MKTAILFANIGNSDLGGKDLKSIFNPRGEDVYKKSKDMWDSGDNENLELLLLGPAIDKIRKNFDLQEIILFGTEQTEYNNQDSFYISYIVRKIICKRYNFNEDNVKVLKVTVDPTDYNELLKYYQKKVKKIKIIEDQIFVSTTGGTQQENISLMLHIYRMFGESVKIVYKPRDEKGVKKEAMTSDIFFEDKKEVATVGAVQIAFELTKTFPYEIKDKEATKERVFKALDIAYKSEVDIVCLPELCMCEQWLSEIELRYPKMIIIAGSYYDKDGHNVCRLIMDSDRDLLPPQLKINPSGFEDPRIYGKGMVSGTDYEIYEDTPFGKFAVPICRDYPNFIRSGKKADIVFVPSFNKANKDFHKIAHQHVIDSLTYVVFANTAVYGGTAIFGRMKYDRLNLLVGAGYKEEDDQPYKLCELKEGKEGIIIAKLNLIHKSCVMPEPKDNNEVFLPVSDINIELI